MILALLQQYKLASNFIIMIDFISNMDQIKWTINLIEPKGRLNLSKARSLSEVMTRFQTMYGFR